MNLLIIVATKLEIKPFLKKINYHKDDWTCFTSLKYNTLELDFLVAGIGLVFTTYHLGKALNTKKYDLIINVGIAGSFSRNLKIGQVVNVVQEEFADLGVEDKDNFKTLFDLGFADKNGFPFREGKLVNNYNGNAIINGLVPVAGISSNTAHGNIKSINSLIEKFEADIETMEGAAFFYMCLQEKVRFAEIRVISNYVEPRNKDNWDIPLALEKLAESLILIVNRL